MLSSPQLLLSQGGVSGNPVQYSESAIGSFVVHHGSSLARLVRSTSALSDIKRAKWFWRGVQERRQRRMRVWYSDGRGGAAFHNPLCPVPIKRCCHAYGQGLTGRSQHGHRSVCVRARTYVSLSVRGAAAAAWCRKRKRKRVRWTTARLGSIWTSGCTGNYRTGLPTTVHRTLTYAWIREHASEGERGGTVSER